MRNSRSATGSACGKARAAAVPRRGSCLASSINPSSGHANQGPSDLPFSARRVAIVTSAGAPQPQGERGGVVIRAANVMRGYVGRPEETANVIRDGWP